MRAIRFITVALTCAPPLHADDFFTREVRPIEISLNALIDRRQHQLADLLNRLVTRNAE